MAVILWIRENTEPRSVVNLFRYLLHINTTFLQIKRVSIELGKPEISISKKGEGKLFVNKVESLVLNKLFIALLIASTKVLQFHYFKLILIIMYKSRQYIERHYSGNLIKRG